MGLMTCMRRVIAIVFIVLWTVSGCRKDPEPAPPIAPIPAPSSPAAVANTEAKEAKEAPAKPVKKAPVLDRVALPTLPPAPDEPLDFVARKAAQRCRPSDAQCAGYDRLAAKIEHDLGRAKELLRSGTDQQKRAIRHALLRTRTDASDELLVTQLTGPSGALDDAVLEAVHWRRTNAAVKPLQAVLKKAVGEDIRKAMDALSAIGTKEALSALKETLTDKRLHPYLGSACRGLARAVSTDSVEDVTRLGSALNATEDQSAGCRGAEVALRVYNSGSRLSANIGSKRLQDPLVAVHQLSTDPRFLRIRVVHGTDNPCDEKEGVTTLRAALSREGEPMVGVGLDAIALNNDGTVSVADVFMLRFDELVLKNGLPVRGMMHMDYSVSKQPRVIVTGHFTGTYCGVQ